jgi:hypothetical protein
MDGARAAKPNAAAEFAALQIEFVAQHPEKWSVALYIHGSHHTVDFERVSHVSSL